MAGQVKQIIIPYAPREAFLPYHNRTERFAVIVAHRRAGKTVATINDIIKRAIVENKPDGRYAYLAPYLNQAKDIAWSYLQKYASPITGTTFNASELRADLPNGARIRLYGADNADRMRGIYLDGIVIDEPADQRGSIFPEIIRPALADRQGWATFIGTPKGHNAFYDTYQQAIENPEWFALMLKASQSGLLPESELKALRLSMSADQYAQELECSFEAAVQGAYYGKIIADIEDEQVCAVPHEPNLPVDVYFDLGFNDATAMWFIQSERSGFKHRIIRYYENSGETISHYVNVLNEWRDKGYTYGRIVLPHDAEIKDLKSGRSVREIMQDMGIRAEVLPRTDNVIGDIDTVRTMLPKCWFDKDNCKEGIEALKQYRKIWDDKRKVFQSHPYHDWTSHAADAFRYFATGYKAIGLHPKAINLPRFRPV
jgi:phage terminase large subunit